MPLKLDSADLAVLSRLLDQVLDLEADQMAAWIAGLPEEQDHLRPMLSAMVAEHLSQEHAGFLSEGPVLDDTSAAETVAKPDDVVGPYRLIREIGRGGMGAVWLAARSDGGLKRQVALKLPALAWGAGLAERMERERDIGALLEHPHIARLYDGGVDVQGRPYLAFEYIDGLPLDEYCESSGLGVSQRLRVFLQVVRAVAYAHGRLIVHRDLKPSNVLVTADGEAHLLDFGIAKLLHEAARADQRLTQDLGRVLTPHYASPEQLQGSAITVASDVYSLGVLLYELLTGRHPYKPERNSLAALEEAVLLGEPPLASSRAQDASTAKSLRGELDAILGKALKREPGQRYATADALADDIERYLNGDNVLARPDSLAYRFTKTLRRHRVGLATAGAVMLAVLGGAGMSIVQAQRASDSAQRARVVKEFVVDVFKINSPGRADNGELRQLPAEMLLQRGGKLIEMRFAGQPQLQAELYGVVGEIFADMGASQLAVDYATREVSTLAAIDAARAEQGRAMLLLARALLSDGRVRDAEVHANSAVALLEEDPPRALDARILRVRVLKQLGKVAEATRELERIEAQTSRPGSAPTLARAFSKTLRANLWVDRGRFDEALPLYLSSIEDAAAVEGAASQSAIDIRLELAYVLVLFDRTPESVAYREAALATLRSLGQAGQIRAALAESEHAFQLVDLAQISYGEAQATVERCLAQLAAMGPDLPEPVKARVSFLLGLVHLNGGHVGRADALISQATQALRPSAETPTRRRKLAFSQGIVAMHAGRHAEAERHLRERLEMAKVMFGESSPWTAIDYVSYADNLTMQGRLDEAETFLGSLPRIEGTRGSGSSDTIYSEEVDFARARIRLDRGDPMPALSAALGSAAQRADRFGGRRSLVGEALCAVGRTTEGLRHLEAGIAARVSHGAYRADPEVARARAMAGRCALESGDRKSAERLAQAAREAFVEQPDVSPYFKRPSETLDKLLAQSVPPNAAGRGAR